MRRFLPLFRAALLALFCFALLALLLLETDAAIDGARRGLALCTETLLPSLFPFLVFSELLVASGAGMALGRIAGAPIRRLFGLSEAGALSVLLGSVCGFPVGSATAVSYRREGSMSASELQRVTLFANNPSSGFLIAAVGTGLLGNKQAGIALFFITLIAAATVGVFLRFLFGKVENAPKTPTNGAQKALSIETFTGSVRRGFSTFLQVTALVIFFASVAAALASLVEALHPPTLLKVMLHGVLELTSGASTAAVTLPPKVAFLAIAALSSFSGLSVCLQIHTLTDGEGTRMGAYLLAKTAQAIIAVALAEGYLLLARPTLGTSESVSTFSTRGNFTLLLAFASLSLLCALLLKIKEKRHAKKRAL